MSRAACRATAIVLVFIAVLAAPWSVSATARSGEPVADAEEDVVALAPTWGTIGALTTAAVVVVLAAVGLTARRGRPGARSPPPPGPRGPR